MSDELLSLVERLCALSLEQEVDDIEHLSLVLTERQELLSALQRADTSTLTPELRTDLTLRLEDCLVRDRALIEQLAALRDEAGKALEGLNSGRAAARGYGTASEPSPAPRRRIG